MRILITGGEGQLAVALQHALSNHDVRAPGHEELDVTPAGSVRRAVGDFQPEIVIHTAAWTDTAGCERDPDRAILVNGEGARNVATACAEAGAPLLYVSTNEVFDGEKGAPYEEGDTPRPVNAYGRSKLAGEERVREAGCDAYIVRTSWVYGPGRVSFPEKIIERVRTDGRLRGVTDEVASPTWTNDLAAAIAQLIETKAYGLYHLAGEGSCSRLEWADEVLKLAGIDVPVEAVKQADFGLPFRKPADSTLANVRAAALGITLRPWREALADHMRTPQVAGLIAEGAGR